MAAEKTGAYPGVMVDDGTETLALVGGPLVGVAEIADLLGVSRQRADQLTRSKGWPEPVDRVAPIDQYTRNAIHLLFKVAGTTITEEQAVKALEAGAHRLPASPRLWRLNDVLQWAAEHGRALNDSDGSKT
jgi:hypothetical protein